MRVGAKSVVATQKRKEQARNTNHLRIGDKVSIRISKEEKNYGYREEWRTYVVVGIYPHTINFSNDIGKQIALTYWDVSNMIREKTMKVKKRGTK